VIGGNLALRAVQPDWAVTSTLNLHLLRPLNRDFEVRGAPLRAGATQVVLDVQVSDGESAAGPGAGREHDVHAHPPREQHDAVRRRRRGAVRVRRRRVGLPRRSSTDRLPRARRARRRGAGRRDYVRNSVGALQGGRCGARRRWRRERRSTRMGVVARSTSRSTFLALGRVGPIRTRTRWLGAHPTTRACASSSWIRAGRPGWRSPWSECVLSV
jgi:hypothetical protein